MELSENVGKLIGNVPILGCKSWVWEQDWMQELGNTTLDWMQELGLGTNTHDTVGGKNIATLEPSCRNCAAQEIWGP